MQAINNGYAEYYLLTEDGKVYNSKTCKYLKPSNRFSYKLRTIDGKSKNISLKELYKLVYNKVFCIDTIDRLENEQFKEIKGTDGNYYISNLGRVKSYVGYEAIILTPTITPKGYQRLQIIQEGQRVNKFVHSLVAAEWLPQPSSIDVDIHHKDFNQLNNNADNLEYLTRVQHSKKHTERRKLISNGEERSSENDSSN